MNKSKRKSGKVALTSHDDANIGFVQDFRQFLAFIRIIIKILSHDMHRFVSPCSPCLKSCLRAFSCIGSAWHKISLKWPPTPSSGESANYRRRRRQTQPIKAGRSQRNWQCVDSPRTVDNRGPGGGTGGTAQSHQLSKCPRRTEKVKKMCFSVQKENLGTFNHRQQKIDFLQLLIIVNLF